MNIARSLFKNTLGILLARVASMGGSMLLVFYLSRVLHAEGLGVYSTALALFGLGTLVSGLGLASFVPRELAKDLSQTNRYLVHTGILVLISALITAIALAGVATNLGYSSETVISICLIALALLPAGLEVVIHGIFVCHHRAEFVAASTVFWTVTRILVSFYLLHRGFGVPSLMLTFTVTSFFSLLISTFFYVRYIERFRWDFDPVFMGNVLRLLKTFAILAIVGGMFAQTETIILSLLKDETDVGVFSAARRLVDVWYLIPVSYMVVVFPTLTRTYQRQPRRSNAIQQRSIKYLLALALPIAVGLFAAADPIVRFLYGPGFEVSIPVLRLMAWQVVLIFVNNVLWRVLLARDQQNLALRVQMISGVIRVGLSLLLIPLLGAVGAALAVMGGYTVYTLMHVFYTQRGGEPVPYLRLAGRFALAAAIMGAFTAIFAQHLNLFILILLAALLYAGLVVLLRGFSQEDRALFLQIWRPHSGRGVSDSGVAPVDN